MQNPNLRLPQVRADHGISRSTIYAQIADGLFPPFVKIGARAVAIPKNESDAVKAARVAGKTDDEIKKLVAELVAARKVQQ